jgi:hypothetical protein
MIVPVWACDLASRFWEQAGPSEPFPRDLAAAIEATGYDVTIKELPNLSVATIRTWLRVMNIVVEAPDRPLRGCLAPSREVCLLFVDANDSPAERRFTVAHELAHYLRDLRRPRDRVIRNLGPRALEVVDRRRPASESERFAAALVGIDLTARLHLFLREPIGVSRAVADAEDAADRLAYELLAPAAHLADVGAERWSDEEFHERLIGDYGLPALEAERYVRLLRPTPPSASAWIVAIRNEFRKEALS